MGETIMDYGPYKLWNDDLIAEPLPSVTDDSSHLTIRGSGDIGTTVSKELIDTIAKEVVEQIKNDYNETKFIWDKEKYYIKHR